jgi:NifU-like protein involved in Fe-S cluster formation
MNYSDLTRRYFESAASAGTLADAFRGAAGQREQGTWVQFDVRVGAEAISAVRFLAFACPHVIAAAAWLAEHSIGAPIRRELPESAAALRLRFDVPVEKMGRLLILEDAWRMALGAAIESAARAHISGGSPPAA